MISLTLFIQAVIESFKGKLKMSASALDLASKCMILNPLKRITAHSGRKHPFCQITKQLSVSGGEWVGGWAVCPRSCSLKRQSSVHGFLFTQFVNICTFVRPLAVAGGIDTDT